MGEEGGVLMWGSTGGGGGRCSNYAMYVLIPGDEAIPNPSGGSVYKPKSKLLQKLEHKKPEEKLFSPPVSATKKPPVSTPTPVGRVPVGRVPVGRVPVGGVPVGGVPVGGVPVGGVLVWGVPA